MTITDTAVHDRREFDQPPTEAERLVWCEWLRRHGIDPHDLPAPGGWVERQPEQRRLTYLAYVCDEQGAIQYDADADCARTETRHVQLDSPPLPWPTP